MTKSKKKICESKLSKTWLPVKANDDGLGDDAAAAGGPSTTASNRKSVKQWTTGDIGANDTVHTFFTSSSLSSKTSVMLGAANASPYATICRRKGSRQTEDSEGYYYELFCGDNDSVSSLPLSRNVDPFHEPFKMSASMPSVTPAYSRSVAGDSLPPLFEEDIFSFLDEYDGHSKSIQDYNVRNEYFLPARCEDKALKKWTVLESLGDYGNLDLKDDFCARPLCLNIGDDRLQSAFMNAQTKSDISAWF